MNPTQPMNTSPLFQKPALLLASFGAFSLGCLCLGCASTPTSDSTGQYVDDTAITTKVKNALLADGAVKSTEISVKTVKGVVQLSGFVDTSDQKAAAEKDASTIAGVKDVNDNLVVK
jgi:osmotically-inducible protein OsmY